MKLITEEDAAVVGLRRRLDRLHAVVYATQTFTLSDQNYFWELLRVKIGQIAALRPPCRILEAGAGISGFATFLQQRGLREKVFLTMHDIFPANADWLRTQADDVLIGPVPQLTGQFDLIVTSFVLEHMTDPRASLEAMWRCLAPGGALFFICPRYEGPFYLSPACDHLGRLSRLSLRFRVAMWRLRVLATGRPAFLLLADAAALHLPFAIDRDAIHLVSWYDIRAFFRQKRAAVTRLPIRWPFRFTLGGLKSIIITRFALLACQVEKP